MVSGGGVEAPEAGLGEFQRVAGRIAEIQRAGTAGPVEFGLDWDAMGGEPVAPGFDLNAGGGKAQVSGAMRAMWGA